LGWGTCLDLRSNQIRMRSGCTEVNTGRVYTTVTSQTTLNCTGNRYRGLHVKHKHTKSLYSVRQNQDNLSLYSQACFINIKVIIMYSPFHIFNLYKHFYLLLCMGVKRVWK
jgi:hypothetical protein